MACESENDDFFEGTEKLLEVWFEADNETADLRAIKRHQWEILLENVNCKILGVKNDDSMMAFLLSESSMFISQKRFILKTCGKTTLLAAIKPLIFLVKNECGFDVVDFFYSRKNYLRPEFQHSLQQKFEDEVSHLDELFDCGTAYALGRINRDCWYLYTVDSVGVVEPDQTLELLMQELDPDKMDIFKLTGSRSASAATKKSGIANLMPDAVIDDYLFDPCGYSMNGMLSKGQYFTIHITPEPEFSYVSFETNVPKESYDELILHVLEIFRPGKFLMTLFSNQTSIASPVHKSLKDQSAISGYRRADHQYLQPKNYDLTYVTYLRANRRLPRVTSLGLVPSLVSAYPSVATKALAPDPPK